MRRPQKPINKTYNFGSITEMNDYIIKAQPDIKEHLIDAILSGDIVEANSYNSVEEGCNYLLTGTHDLTEKYIQFASTSIPAPLPEVGTYQFSEEPITGLFDVATFCSNTPEYWLNEVECNRINKVAEVNINFGARYDITAEQFFQRFLDICAYVDQLEQSGVRCKIVAERTVIYSHRDAKSHFKVTIKEPEDVMNIGQLVYLFCTPAMMRFAWFMISAKDHGENFGACSSDKDHEAQQVEKALTTENFIYCPSFYCQYYGTIVKKEEV